jgi:hypothetical protein
MSVCLWWCSYLSMYLSTLVPNSTVVILIDVEEGAGSWDGAVFGRKQAAHPCHP